MIPKIFYTYCYSIVTKKNIRTKNFPSFIYILIENLFYQTIFFYQLIILKNSRKFFYYTILIYCIKKKSQKFFLYPLYHIDLLTLVYFRINWLVFWSQKLKTNQYVLFTWIKRFTFLVVHVKQLVSYLTIKFIGHNF
jgi:hypothetical protein